MRSSSVRMTGMILARRKNMILARRRTMGLARGRRLMILTRMTRCMSLMMGRRRSIPSITAAKRKKRTLTRMTGTSSSWKVQSTGIDKSDGYMYVSPDEGYD